MSPTAENVKLKRKHREQDVIKTTYRSSYPQRFVVFSYNFFLIALKIWKVSFHTDHNEYEDLFSFSFGVI